MTLCAPLLFLACFAVVHLCTTSSRGVLGLEVHRVRRLLRTSSSSSSSGCWVYRSRRCYRGVLQQHCCDGGTRRAACGVSAALLLVNACDAVSATDARTASERADRRLYHNSSINMSKLSLRWHQSQSTVTASPRAVSFVLCDARAETHLACVLTAACASHV
jgi:hypothetical protein